MARIWELGRDRALLVRDYGGYRLCFGPSDSEAIARPLPSPIARVAPSAARAVRSLARHCL